MHAIARTASYAHANATGELVRSKLIENYGGLVHAIARQLRSSFNTPASVDDLFGYGWIGLLDAADRFQSNRGITFRHYAYPRIRGAMIDGLRKEGWQSRRHYEAERAEARAAEKLPSGGAASEPSQAQLGAAATAAADPAPFAAAPMLSSALDDTVPVEPIVDLDELIDLRAALKRLPGLERAVLERYYFADCTLQEVADGLGMDKSWASKLHARGVELLKRLLTGDQHDAGAR